MLVPTDLPVLTGEPLLVSFRPPLSGRWLDAEAVVARVVHGRRPGDHGRRLGLSFQGLAPGTHGSSSSSSSAPCPPPAAARPRGRHARRTDRLST